MLVDEVVAELEICETFANEQDFRTWWSSTGELLSPAIVNSCVESSLRNGVSSPTFGFIPPSEIELRGSNYRESLRARGLNSRQRALLELVTEEVGLASSSARIYAPEAMTPLALHLRSRFPRFLGSEYAECEADRERLYPIQTQDLQNLTLAPNSFDVVFTCDVLEHVPSIHKALKEMFRVLAPGGVMLSSFPFTWRGQSTVKAVLVDGHVAHLTEPEYHGNPLSDDGSLVFTVPGWEIMDWTKAVGFSDVEMVLIASRRQGIFGSEPPLVNILRARKSRR